MTNQCDSCKFNGSEGCGVNLGLWRSRKVMHRSSQLDREALESQLPKDCADFEVKPKMRLELEASEDDWKKLLDAIKADGLGDLAAQIRDAIGVKEEGKVDRTGFLPLPPGVTVATFGDPVVRRSGVVSEVMLRHPCHLGPSGMSTGYTLRMEYDEDDSED